MDKIKRFVVKSSMFLSSYFPLYIMLLILYYDKYNSVEKLKGLRPRIFFVTMMICILISIITVILIGISYGNKGLSIKEIERPDDTVISYMMTYIIPVATTNLLSKNEMLVNLILFLLIGYLYIRLNLLYLNPLWSIFGFLSYRVNEDVVVITNIKYSDLKLKKKNKISLKGLYLANDIFFAAKKNNI